MGRRHHLYPIEKGFQLYSSDNGYVHAVHPGLASVTELQHELTLVALKRALQSGARPNLQSGRFSDSLSGKNSVIRLALYHHS